MLKHKIKKMVYIPYSEVIVIQLLNRSLSETTIEDALIYFENAFKLHQAIRKRDFEKIANYQEKGHLNLEVYTPSRFLESKK